MPPPTTKHNTTHCQLSKLQRYPEMLQETFCHDVSIFNRMYGFTSTSWGTSDQIRRTHFWWLFLCLMTYICSHVCLYAILLQTHKTDIGWPLMSVGSFLQIGGNLCKIPHSTALEIWRSVQLFVSAVTGTVMEAHHWLCWVIWSCQVREQQMLLLLT